MNTSVQFKGIKNSDMFGSVPQNLKLLFNITIYPWEIIPTISEYISIISREGYTMLSEGIWIGKNTSVAESAKIEPPAVIGSNCDIRPGAYIRGNVIIGDNCVIGNSTEIKNSIVMNNVQLPHYNYVGDSVIGDHAHLGAGAICSNLKSDKSNVTIKTEPAHETGLRKLGAIIGDRAEIGCNCVLNPGTIIGRNTRVYPLTSVRGVIPENSIMKSGSVIVKADIE